MSVRLVPEEDIRAALRLYRADANVFEVGIRARIKAGEESREHQDTESQSPLLRVAAAILPWPLIAGGKMADGGSKLSSVALGQKLLGYAALPAISLFLLVGAAFFSAAKIRSVQKENHPDIGDEEEMRDAVRQWWSRYKWVAGLVFATVVILPMVGATWMLFLMLLISFGVLLCFLSSFAKLGVGNRLVIGQSCFMGLMLLGQAMANVGVGKRDIHFVDQTLITVVLFAGTLILIPFVVCGMKRLGIFGPPIEIKEKASKSSLLIGGFSCLLVIGSTLLVLLLLNRSGNGQMPVFAGYKWLLPAAMILVPLAVLIVLAVGRFRKASATRLAAGRQWLAAGRQWIWGLMFVSIMAPMIMWFTNQIWWPATSARIKGYVESFQEGPFPSIAWRDWEIPASWTIEAGLDPDLSRARGLLDGEIDNHASGYQLPGVLGSAFRVGLVRTDQIQRLVELESSSQFIGFEARRQSLIPEASTRQPDRIIYLNHSAWVIYALNQSGRLSPEDRDFLEQRLLATFDELADATANVLRTALRVTQLLDVIDRPIDRDHYRERVHQWLRKFHSKKTHFFQIEGGFEQYEGSVSSMQSTSHAVELMEIYGIPDNLDLNWIRSYLRPLFYRAANDKWIAAVTLDRLNGLPGVAQPTWAEIIYYERSLMAAMVLVALCIYATLSSPNPAIDVSSNHNTVGNDVS